MIPYFDQPKLQLGPLAIHAFGVMVVSAVLIGLRVIKLRAGKDGLDPILAQRLTNWILVGGFLGAHLVDRLVYFPGQTLADPFSLLRLWEGLSSFGGFAGALTGVALFLRSHPLEGRAWRYLDVVAYAFPFGWVLGRLGCFLAFDHPGSPTRFILGQTYRDGVVRHNLGLEEALYTMLLVAVFTGLGRRARPPGTFVGALALLYAPFRFALDFMRKIDVRYFGLTPAQYGSLALAVAGILILARSHRSRIHDHTVSLEPSAAGPGTDLEVESRQTRS
jgi:phosphatidylglycerol:prolipoprotein diacylglycerol transferase